MVQRTDSGYRRPEYPRHRTARPPGRHLQREVAGWPGEDRALRSGLGAISISALIALPAECLRSEISRRGSGSIKPS